MYMNVIKKITLLVLLLIASTTFLNAQVYVSGGLGYGVPSTPEIFGLSYNQATSDITNGYGNAGQGLSVKGAAGYMFNENFGVELGAYYFRSPEIFVQDTVNGDKFYNTYTTGWHLRLTPALVFMAGNGKVTPYAKVGLCFPVAGSANARREANDPLLVNELFGILNYTDNNGQDVTADRFDLEAQFKGQFSLGFESVAGVDYDLNEKLSLFGEVFLTFLRIRRATSEVKKAVATMSSGDEYNILPILSIGGVYQYSEFVDEVNLLEVETAMQEANDVEVILPSGFPFPAILTPQGRVTDYGTTPEKAHTLLASDGAYNAIGINIGVRFNF